MIKLIFTYLPYGKQEQTNIRTVRESLLSYSKKIIQNYTNKLHYVHHYCRNSYDIATILNSLQNVFSHRGAKEKKTMIVNRCKRNSILPTIALIPKKCIHFRPVILLSSLGRRIFF